MATDTSSMVRCGICLEKKTPDDIQILNCKHSFCGLCLSIYQGALCPAERCECGRSTDILVDEMANGEMAARIPLGTHTLNMLDIEEKLMCDGRRGALGCMNVARMSLANCRHNYCYECLVKKLQSAKETNMAPTCPLTFCANKMLKAEFQQLASCYALPAELCSQMNLLIAPDPQSQPTSLKDEDYHVVECSVYGRKATMKRIIIPKSCVVSDMLSAILQLQKLAKNRTASSLGLYVRHDESAGPVKFERILPKMLGKKPVKECNWPENFAVVIDLEGQLAKK